MAIPNQPGVGFPPSMIPGGIATGSAGPFQQMMQQQAAEAQRASATGELTVGSGIPASANVSPIGDTIQLGVFSIPSVWVYTYPEEIRAFMSNCIVLRASHSLDGVHIEYIATSPSFKTIPAGCKPRKYQVVLDIIDDDNTPAINFKHVADYIKNLRKTPTPQNKGKSLKDSFVKQWSKKAGSMKSGGIPLTSMAQNELLAVAAQAMDARNDLEKEIAQVRREAADIQNDIYRRQQEAIGLLNKNISEGVTGNNMSLGGVHKSLMEAIRDGDKDKVAFFRSILTRDNL